MNTIKGGHEMTEIGKSVIVTTCQGEFRGQITGYGKGFQNERLYQVSGPKILTQVKSYKEDRGQKLNTSIHCPKCDNSVDCVFKTL